MAPPPRRQFRMSRVESRVESRECGKVSAGEGNYKPQPHPRSQASKNANTAAPPPPRAPAARRAAAVWTNHRQSCSCLLARLLASKLLLRSSAPPLLRSSAPPPPRLPWLGSRVPAFLLWASSVVVIALFFPIFNFWIFGENPQIFGSILLWNCSSIKFLSGTFTRFSLIVSLHITSQYHRS